MRGVTVSAERVGQLRTPRASGQAINNADVIETSRCFALWLKSVYYTADG